MRDSPARAGWARLRSRLSYANVASSLALFLVVTGGGAFALSHRNSVHSRDIAPGAVRSSDIKDRGVRKRDIRPGAISGVVSASDSSGDTFTLETTPSVVLDATLVVPVKSRLMGAASVGLQSDGSSAVGFGLCQMNHGLGQPLGAVAPDGGSSVQSRTVLALNGAALVEPGTYGVQVSCKKDGANSLGFFFGDLLVWAVPVTP